MTPSGQPRSYLLDLPPARGPFFWETADARHIAWYEFGDAAGTPLFYYHGWPSSALQARLVGRLAMERGIRVIAMDRPGMGRSTFIPGRRLEDWPATVAAFADAHGIGKFLQLGVSGGGPYVLACAAMMPERILGSAVLCGAAPITSSSPRFPAHRAMIAVRRLPPACFAPLFAFAKWTSRDGKLRQPAAWLGKHLPESDREAMRINSQVVPIFVESFHEGIRQGAREALADGGIYFDAWNIDLSRVHAAIHYWHGGEDTVILIDEARDFISRIPGATLTIEPDMGHYSLALYRAPDAMDHLAGCIPENLR